LEGRFTADELHIVIAGIPEIDIADMRANTKYEGYSETDQQSIWLCEVVEAEMSLLMQFSSGTPLAPVEGFGSLPCKIARVGIHENPANNPLPTAHTCWNQLDLPAYTSKEELREKLFGPIAYLWK
jgi:E3 ubiquitin-protein ligase HUWE1